MKSRQHHICNYCKTFVTSLFLVIVMSSCYDARVATEAQAGTETQGQTVHFFFWGLIQTPAMVTTPVCDSLGATGMAEVTVKNNFGYSLITVVTFGIWSPTRIEWKCSKPPQKVGEL